MVLMLGYGFPYGLLNPNQFPDAGSYIIDESMFILLKSKSNSIFIWYSGKFVHKHGLARQNCGMFISEVRKANFYCFEAIEWDMINQSNERFASIISTYVKEPIEILYQKLLYEYVYLTRTNPIARFNLDRLYLNCLGTNKNPIKVVAI